MTRTLLAVHAHPDDESITMAGTLARYAAEGARVCLITATLGEEGEVIPPELAGLAAPVADQLGGYRLTELERACACLGVDDHRWLGGLGTYRDSGMVGTPSAAHPRAFHRARTGGPAHEEAVAALTEVLEQVRPQVVATYDADGGYGHPDHIATHDVGLAAAVRAGVDRVVAVVRPRRESLQALQALAVPPGLRAARPEDLGFTVDDEAVDIRVDVERYADARGCALAAHRTQLDLLPGGFTLSNRFAQPLLPVECYRVLHGVGTGGGVVDDLFAGLP
ncbi:N-acetyl-1-D-myo-inositol-2-amino-2-deoxy-alpha-D-glucopyranoside deacetylase [Nakamurella endophytica]|uniref:1D-myo-inositol 2-acetamido-2-deoxy-alpha-D-glucopyranoside deacetylase n=1 Tax=Nakamurella endophytica TaxID=1748367 RepID=A0A917WB94_9ACTN|nr:N-acetyl-1-D-myo-inositol-2-amino-2-deoxy-alpha-D-glucopyranoside deacetylase [Nakamurella endophytica]GGL86446.1 1D-myo-inositol 2-acetamido-2-deoxy-alpha-D-glucopyranoside deacetylase [Nakamurella endophytica]